MSSLSSGSVRPKRARKGQCPICHGDGCAIWPAGGICQFCANGLWRGQTCRFCNGTAERQATIICRRVQSSHPSKAHNGWIHSPDAEVIASLSPAKPEYDLASIDHRHAVYSALLECLPLNKSHDQHLQNERGLSEEAITAGEFASVPLWNAADDLTSEIAAAFDLSGVPGFFQVRDKWCWRGCGRDGFMIPIRDYGRRIAAMQIRWCAADVDAKHRYMLVSGAPDKLPHGGTRSGAPNHFIRFDPGAKSVLIIEGILKAEIVAEWSHLVGLRCPIVACVGTGTFGDIGAQLKGLMPSLRVAWTAFDRNQEGKGETDTRERERILHGRLAAAGVKPVDFRWPSYKGFDDYLLSIRSDV